MARKFKFTFMRSMSIVCHLEQKELKPMKWKKLIHLPIVFPMRHTVRNRGYAS